MHEVNLDISHSDMLRIDDEEQHSPHVLILPSTKQKHFSKVGTYVLILGLLELIVISLSILSQ